MRVKGARATICKSCGKTLGEKRNGAYCWTCCNSIRRAASRAKKIEQEREARATSIADINTAARNAGTSYGKYVAGC